MEHSGHFETHIAASGMTVITYVRNKPNEPSVQDDLTDDYLALYTTYNDDAS